MDESAGDPEMQKLFGMMGNGNPGEYQREMAKKYHYENESDDNSDSNTIDIEPVDDED